MELCLKSIIKSKVAQGRLLGPQHQNLPILRVTAKDNAYLNIAISLTIILEGLSKAPFSPSLRGCADA